MPSTPVFMPDREMLKSRLRLSGATSEDTEALIDDAMQQARLTIYDRLSSGIITTIAAVTWTDNPATDNERLRSKGALVEQLLVRSVLFRTIPQLMMDSSGKTQLSWNDEGLTRGMGASEIERQLEEMALKIDDLFLDLGGAIEDNTSFRVSVIGPDETNSRPGSSIFRGCR